MAGTSGKGDEFSGRVRKAWGELTDDQEQKDKGTVEKASGKLKQGIDKVRDAAEDALGPDRNRR